MKFEKGAVLFGQPPLGLRVNIKNFKHIILSVVFIVIYLYQLLIEYLHRPS
jgi:hypothetical protein